MCEFNRIILIITNIYSTKFRMRYNNSYNKNKLHFTLLSSVWMLLPHLHHRSSLGCIHHRTSHGRIRFSLFKKSVKIRSIEEPKLRIRDPLKVEIIKLHFHFHLQYLKVLKISIFQISKSEISLKEISVFIKTTRKGHVEIFMNQDFSQFPTNLKMRSTQ